MSGSSQAGRGSGHFVIGEVVDVDDPWQSGQCKVKWTIGSAVQGDLDKKDLPWSKCMSPSTNPSLGKVGGPHTGLRVGSKVYGFPTDGAGQEFIIMGSVVKSGEGDPDQQNKPDSDVPTGTKEQTKDDKTQPNYGDKNQVAKKHGGQDIVENSIIDNFARDEAGPQKRKVRYPDPDNQQDSIGNIARIPGGDHGAV